VPGTSADHLIQAATAGSSAEAPSSQQAAARVLVVDDESTARKLLSLILNGPAFRCISANSGEEALVALQREPFDAVISDLNMPGISGLELLSEVRGCYPGMAFLVVTGTDDVDVGVAAMRTGADDYLVKPFREGTVLASLERALHKRALERQVENYRQHLEEMVVERTAQLHDALEQVERSYEDTLQGLGAAIDLRDHGTAGHSQRVCRYSIEIARRMGWSDEQLKTLARGAHLHDIGKLGIPDGILLKPGALDAREWELMQRHVLIGFDLVKNIPFLADAAEIVLMHHERFAGGGYPHGLKSDEIAMGARIFSVADAFDVITSDRPYKRASSFQLARETIRRMSGSQFDPKVVEVFLSIDESAWSEIAKR
jgi:response regulator RpfG family c-di-GMP phosphodiesterase